MAFPHEMFYALEIFLGGGSLNRCFGCNIRIGYLIFYTVPFSLLIYNSEDPVLSRIGVVST